jgi:hypothetical protein
MVQPPEQIPAELPLKKVGIQRASKRNNKFFDIL